MSSEQPLVELSSVVRQYGSGLTAIRAIDQVSIKIKAGERVALIGPSGAGKSTLLGLLGLIDRADEGDVRFAGASANGLSEDARADLRRRYVGFVFQLFHLIPALSAVENVAVPLLPYADRRPTMERAQRLLVDLGLGDRLNNRPGELSGGEQQRVGIARALVASPSLILADEPTGNLDSRTSNLVVELLLQLQTRHGFALVVATHDVKLADRLDRVVTLIDGHEARGR